MDIFGQKALAKSLDKTVASLKQMQDQRISALMSQFYTQIFPNYKTIKEQLVYQTMDDIYAVVSRLAMTSAMVPLYGEGKDGTEVESNDNINYVLDQMTFQFKELVYLNLLTTGEAFILKQRLKLGPNAGKIKLKNLNPANIIVNVSEYFPFEITGYVYQDAGRGVSFPISVEDIIYIKLENPTVDANEQIRGLSPIRVLSMRLTRLKAQMDVSVAQMQNGGLPGVIYDKSPGFGLDEAAHHKNNFANFLNNSSNKSAPYIWGGDVGYVPIGSTLADLDLASLADIDFDKICNVYGVSSTWFNNKKAATESNVKEMVRLIYTNAVLPNVMRFQDAINEQLISQISTEARIRYDISDITELQKDMRDKAETYARLPVIVPNEVREGMGWDRINDPMMDTPLVKAGYYPIEDISPLNIQTSDYGGNLPNVPQGDITNPKGPNQV
jgi:HK97 family phage portal protein